MGCQGSKTIQAVNRDLSRTAEQKSKELQGSVSEEPLQKKPNYSFAEDTNRGKSFPYQADTARKTSSMNPYEKQKDGLDATRGNTARNSAALLPILAKLDPPKSILGDKAIYGTSTKSKGILKQVFVTGPNQVDSSLFLPENEVKLGKSEGESSPNFNKRPMKLQLIGRPDSLLGFDPLVKSPIPANIHNEEELPFSGTGSIDPHENAPSEGSQEEVIGEFMKKSSMKKVDPISRKGSSKNYDGELKRGVTMRGSLQPEEEQANGIDFGLMRSQTIGRKKNYSIVMPNGGREFGVRNMRQGLKTVKNTKEGFLKDMKFDPNGERVGPIMDSSLNFSSMDNYIEFIKNMRSKLGDGKNGKSKNLLQDLNTSIKNPVSVQMSNPSTSRTGRPIGILMGGSKPGSRRGSGFLNDDSRDAMSIKSNLQIMKKSSRVIKKPEQRGSFIIQSRGSFKKELDPTPISNPLIAQDDSVKNPNMLMARKMSSFTKKEPRPSKFRDALPNPSGSTSRPLSNEERKSVRSQEPPLKDSPQKSDLLTPLTIPEKSVKGDDKADGQASESNMIKTATFLADKDNSHHLGVDHTKYSGPSHQDFSFMRSHEKLESKLPHTQSQQKGSPMARSNDGSSIKPISSRNLFGGQPIPMTSQEDEIKSNLISPKDDFGQEMFSYGQTPAADSQRVFAKLQHKDSDPKILVSPVKSSILSPLKFELLTPKAAQSIPRPPSAAGTPQNHKPDEHQTTQLIIPKIIKSASNNRIVKDAKESTPQNQLAG